MHILVAHDDPRFLDALSTALRGDDHQVAAHVSTLDAWDVLAGHTRYDMLITRVRFPAGQPHGAALARHACGKHQGIRVIFMAAPEMRAAVEDLGVFLPAPVSVAEVVKTVNGWSDLLPPSRTG